MNLPRILLSYLLFNIAFAAAGPVVLPALHLKDVAGQTPYAYLVDFHNRLSKYQSAEECRTTIVGPSYGVYLRRLGAANVSLGGANHKEIAHLITHACRPDDRVLYILTIREVTQIRQAPRRELLYKPTRAAVILRMAFQDSFGVPLRVPTDKCSADYGAEHDLLRVATGYDFPKPVSCRIIKQIKSNSTSLDGISIGPLEVLAHQHPDIVFVVHPTVPLTPLQSEHRFAQQINRIVAAQTKLSQLLKDSSLMYCDFTSAMSPEYFRDMFHLNADWRKAIRATALADHLIPRKENRGVRSTHLTTRSLLEEENDRGSESSRSCQVCRPDPSVLR